MPICLQKAALGQDEPASTQCAIEGVTRRECVILAKHPPEKEANNSVRGGVAWRCASALPREPVHPVPQDQHGVTSTSGEHHAMPVSKVLPHSLCQKHPLQASSWKSQPAARTSQGVLLGFPQPSWKKEGRGKFRACTEHH